MEVKICNFLSIFFSKQRLQESPILADVENKVSYWIILLYLINIFEPKKNQGMCDLRN